MVASIRERKRSAQRERILESARLLFASRGLDNVTMGEVAKLAGVARTTVFNYFPSKYNLMEAITEGVLQYYVGMLRRALADTDSSTPTLIRALFDHMASGIERAYPFHRGVFREIVKIQLGLDEGGEAQRTRDATLDLVERLVRRGQERGELSDDFAVEDLTRGLDSMANGTIIRWLYDDTSGSLRERLRRAAEIFLGGAALNLDRFSSEALPDLTPEESFIPIFPS